jgi:hypothetical protein
MSPGLSHNLPNIVIGASNSKNIGCRTNTSLHFVINNFMSDSVKLAWVPGFFLKLYILFTPSLITICLICSLSNHRHSSKLIN